MLKASLDIYIQTHKLKYAVKLAIRNFGFKDGSIATFILAKTGKQQGFVSSDFRK